MSFEDGDIGRYVNFDKPDDNVTYLGRNGTGYCAGVAVYTYSKDKIMLVATKRMGGGAPCAIDVPMKHIRELCIALQADVLEEAMRRLPPEMLPRFVGDDGDLKQMALKLLAKKEV